VAAVGVGVVNDHRDGFVTLCDRPNCLDGACHLEAVVREHHRGGGVSEVGSGVDDPVEGSPFGYGTGDEELGTGLRERAVEVLDKKVGGDKPAG